ncbi:MAG: hypothetical protein ABJL67_04280 [Sulfitobacter sp.]
MEKQIDALLSRIMSASSEAVIGAYEKKLADLEADRARFEDMMLHHRAPDGSFEEKLERLLTFLSSTWKLWENGHVSLRRVVLKLVFADRIAYHRKQVLEHPKLPLYSRR